MRKLFRGSILALVATLGVATAYAALHPDAGHRAARLKPHRLAELAQPANPMIAPARALASRMEVPNSPRPAGATCDLTGCADALAAESCPLCLEATGLALSGLDGDGLDGSGTLPAVATLGALAPEFRVDTDAINLVSFAPSAAAAPTPEISTAGMLTLGFAGVAWAVRRARRQKSSADRNPTASAGALLSAG